MKNLGWIGRGLSLAGSLALAVTLGHAANFTLDAMSGTVAVKGATIAKAASVGSELATGDTVTTTKGSSADLGLISGGRKISNIHVWGDSTYTVSETIVQEDGITKGGGSLTQGAIAGSFNPKAASSVLTVKAADVSAAIQDSTTFLVRSAGDVYCYTGRIVVTSSAGTYTITSGQSFSAATQSVVPHNLPAPFALVSAPVVQVITPTASPSQPGGQ
jgi:hypothetical protein